jgi:hypothetical protein
VTDSGMNPSRPPRSFLGPVLGALHSIVIVVTHTAVGATILVSIWSLEQLIHLLWGDREPMIFNMVPLHTVIQTADAGVLVAFIVWGTYSAIVGFKE